MNTNGIDQTMHLSVFRNKDDNQPEQHALGWESLAQRLCRYDERPFKDGKAWSPVTYKPGTTRGKANVELVFALVLDFDHGLPDWQLIEVYEWLAHTTHSHTPETPRWRVVLPLARPIGGADWPAFWLRANAFFGGCVDPATKDSSRIFYLPSCPPGAQHEVKQQHGVLLDPNSLPEIPTYDPPRQKHTSSILNRAYLGGWAARFMQAKCDELALMPRDSGRNAACNRIAHLLAGLVADPTHDLGEDVVRDELLEACARNRLIADDGERSVLATIESGFESGVLRPWSPADQDQLLGTRKYQRSYDQPQIVDVRDLRLDVVRLSDVAVEPIHWLWRGRLAKGKLTLLMGDPGLGKSLITHWLAATVSTGGEWPEGGQCERSAAIVFTIEDALADTVKPRLVAAGADMNRVIAVRGVVDQKASLDARMFALEEHVALLEELVEDEGASLIVMDPVSSYLGPNVNTHKETDVRRVLGMLGQMAERTGVAVLNVIHLNKGNDVAALNRATGSVAFPAVSRIVLGVVPDPLDEDGHRRLFLPLKCNVSRMPSGLGYRIESAPSSALLIRVEEQDRPPVLVWDDEPVLDDMSLALDRGSVQDRTATEEVVQALGQIFDNNGNERIPSNEVLRQLRDAGVSTSGSVLTSAKKQLGIKSRQDGQRGPWFWLPPTKKIATHTHTHARVSHPTETQKARNPRNPGETWNPSPSSSIPQESPDSFDSDRLHARVREDIPDADGFSDRGRPTKFCPDCQRALTLGAYEAHLPCDRRRPATDLEPDDMSLRGTLTKYCARCGVTFQADSWLGHAPCHVGLPPGLCPIHRVLFSLHECDAL